MSVRVHDRAQNLVFNSPFSTAFSTITALYYYIIIYLRGEDGKDGELHLEGITSNNGECDGNEKRTIFQFNLDSLLRVPI